MSVTIVAVMAAGLQASALSSHCMDVVIVTTSSPCHSALARTWHRVQQSSRKTRFSSLLAFSEQLAIRVQVTCS